MTGYRLMTRLTGLAVTVVMVVVASVAWSRGGGGSHSYSFLRTQDGQPVTFNHCRAIRYQVNPFEAPAHWQQIVQDAIADISRASGFVFIDVGTSTKRDLIGGSYYPGSPPEPVLITWSDQMQASTLKEAWGFATPLMYDVGDGHLVSLTGKVVMGTYVFQHYRGISDDDVQRLVLEHELGHVLGLGHVEDHSQLMNNGYVGQTGLGRGDIAGLRHLHDVPCR